METPEEIKRTVREKYAGIAVQKDRQAGTCGCGCRRAGDYSVVSEDYSHIGGYAPEADLGLGCGIPTEHVRIRPGDTVVDLGSGAGNDCFIAAKETGPGGRVIGIDMTEAMVHKARHNAATLGYENVEFRLGEIENTFLGDNFTDVVISNCVFNLSPDKAAAFSETFRILKPGGRLCISDIVIEGILPPPFLKEAEVYAGCVAGALQEDQYLAIVRETGFRDIHIVKKRRIDLPAELTIKYNIPEESGRNGRPGIFSITVIARKPNP